MLAATPRRSSIATQEAGRQVETQLRKSGECTFIRCDVTDDDAVRQAVEQTVKLYGRLDAAFNAAGIDGEHGKAHRRLQHGELEPRASRST